MQTIDRRRCEQRSHRIGDTCDVGRDSLDRFVGHVVFVGEIELRFDARSHGHQPVRPVFDNGAQSAFRNPKRCTTLRLGLGAEQIAEAFGFGQIEHAVGQRTAREFPRLGGAQTRLRSQDIANRRHHRTPAVEMEFDQILTRRGTRSRKGQDQRTIEQSPVGGIAQGAHARHAR